VTRLRAGRAPSVPRCSSGLDGGHRVGRPGRLLLLHEVRCRDDAAFTPQRPGPCGVPGGNGMVDLVHRALAKQRLVGIAGCCRLENSTSPAVSRSMRWMGESWRKVQAVFEPPPARSRAGTLPEGSTGKKCGLSTTSRCFILVQHHGLQRNGHLVPVPRGGSTSAGAG